MTNTQPSLRSDYCPICAGIGVRQLSESVSDFIGIRTWRRWNSVVRFVVGKAPSKDSVCFAIAYRLFVVQSIDLIEALPPAPDRLTISLLTLPLISARSFDDRFPVTRTSVSLCVHPIRGEVNHSSEISSLTRALWIGVLIGTVANDSAHRWRPLCDSRITKLRGGAAIRCSAVLRLSPSVRFRCIEPVSPRADKNLVDQDQQVRQAPWVIAS